MGKNNMKYIKFRIYSGERDENGRTKKSVIRQIESNMDGVSTNAVNIILNAFADSSDLIKENIGFPYTLPFELS